MPIFVWSRGRKYRGTVERGEPLINLRAIARNLKRDYYWDYEAEELGFTDADNYWIWRWGFEITQTLLHELTHLATGLGNDHPSHDNWDNFLFALLG
jgi:hypothetical protein